MASRGAYCLGLVAMMVAAMCLVQPSWGMNMRRFDLFEHESLLRFDQDGGLYELEGDNLDPNTKLRVHFYELIGLFGDFWGAGSFTDSVCLAQDAPRRFFELADQIRGQWRSEAGIQRRNALITGLRKQLRDELEKYTTDAQIIPGNHQMSMESIIAALNQKNTVAPPQDFGANDMLNMARTPVQSGDMTSQANILGGNIDHFSDCAVMATDKVSREINLMFRAGRVKEANFYLAALFHFTSDLFSGGHTITPS